MPFVVHCVAPGRLVSSAPLPWKLVALIVPVTIVAVMVTNFPLPQLTNGPLLRALMHSEAAQGLPVVDASSLTFALPADGIAHIAKRFTAPFGAIGPMAFVVAMLTVLAGIASSPWLLPRVTMTPGVYETRKSLGWGTVEVTPTGPSAFAVDSLNWAEAQEGAGLQYPGCYFTAGLLADFVSRIAAAPLAVMEVECRSRGDARCRWLVGAPDTLTALYERMAEGADYLRVLGASG